jgi:glycosyltransferase involved in cell wall biosynthesis
VHRLAVHLVRRLGCAHVIDVGCTEPRELAKVHPNAKIVGLGIGVDLRPARFEYRFGRWIDWDPASDVLETVEPDISVDSVIVAAIDPEGPVVDDVVANLRRLMDYAPAAIVTATHRTSVGELRSVVEAGGMCVDFVGRTISDDVEFRKDAPLAVLRNNHSPAIEPAPAGYRVVAMMAMYNEQDIIVPSINGLLEQGAEVYLLDNWSTDRTVELAEGFLGRGVIAIERIPRDGPSGTFPYVSILARKAELATELVADWFLHVDVDEVRRSPWPGVSLRDALYHVDRAGFNAVDHTVLRFVPVDNGYVDGANFERYFRHFRFTFQQDFQVKAWRNERRPVALGSGHRAAFAGRRVYPYNFVYKHYPIRSQAHGERKIFAERQPRMEARELASGLHGHYGRFRPDADFIGDPSQLTSFDDESFYEDLLVERLASIGPDERAAWSARAPGLPRWRALMGRAHRAVRRRFVRLRRTS